MPSIAGSATLIALLMLAHSVVDQAAAAPGDLLSTDKTNVNVRASPSTTADIVSRINPGETVIEIGEEGDWRLVKLPGGDREGWVFSPLLEPVVDAPKPSDGITDQTAAESVVSDNLASRTAAFDGNLVGDPAKGEIVFYKCGSCHTTVRDVHAQGPSLVGVFGRSPANAPGYRYSGAMKSFAQSGALWDETTLDRFIQRPPRVVKGTTMPFSGVRDPQDRRDLIAYLQQL